MSSILWVEDFKERALPEPCVEHSPNISKCSDCTRFYCMECKTPGVEGSFIIDVSSRCRECKEKRANTPFHNYTLGVFTPVEEPEWAKFKTIDDLTMIDKPAGQILLDRWFGLVPEPHRKPVRAIVADLSREFLGRHMTEASIQTFKSELHGRVRAYLERR